MHHIEISWYLDIEIYLASLQQSKNLDFHFRFFVCLLPCLLSFLSCARRTVCMWRQRLSSFNAPRLLIANLLLSRNFFTMAYSIQGRSNAELITNLKNKAHVFSSSNVEAAMLKVDRKDFCVETRYAYADFPTPIGFEATLSAPHMHALALELSEPVLFKPASKHLR